MSYKCKRNIVEPNGVSFSFISFISEQVGDTPYSEIVADDPQLRSLWILIECILYVKHLLFSTLFSLYVCLLDFLQNRPSGIGRRLGALHEM